MLAIVSKEFIKYVNGVREGGFALILGPSSPTALNRNYLSIQFVFNCVLLLNSVLICLLQAFAFRARELLHTICLSPGRNLASHCLTFFRNLGVLP